MHADQNPNPHTLSKSWSTQQYGWVNPPVRTQAHRAAEKYSLMRKTQAKAQAHSMFPKQVAPHKSTASMPQSNTHAHPPNHKTSHRASQLPPCAPRDGGLALLPQKTSLKVERPLSAALAAAALAQLRRHPPAGGLGPPLLHAVESRGVWATAAARLAAHRLRGAAALHQFTSGCLSWLAQHRQQSRWTWQQKLIQCLRLRTAAASQQV